MTYFETLLVGNISCNRCGDDDTELAKVEYTDDKIERISLCRDCATVLADSDHVLEVSFNN
jgi:hypothetical protein